MHMSRFIPVTGALKICHPSDGSVDIMPNLWDFFCKSFQLLIEPQRGLLTIRRQRERLVGGGENNLRILI